METGWGHFARVTSGKLSSYSFALCRMMRRRKISIKKTPQEHEALNTSNESLKEDSNSEISHSPSEHEPHHHHHHHHHHESRKHYSHHIKWFFQRKRAIFLFGIVLGGFMAFLFATVSDDAVYQQALKDMFKNMNLSDYVFNHPLKMEKLINDIVKQLVRPLDEEKENYFESDKEFIQSLKQNYPAFLIPGLVSTGLESWSTDECAKKYFRKRMWGTMTMFQSALIDRQCWLSHMKLGDDGYDPPGVKLRAAQGLEAADYFFPGYWVWAKVIENMASIGYDNNLMQMAAYDWRLSLTAMEIRDQYFSKLKNSLELSKRLTGKKAVLIAHSMGTNVMYYFFRWVESKRGGNGGKFWVDDHIESLVNIGGPLFGVPKALSSLISGEMKDTAYLNVLVSYIVEQILSKADRLELWRSFGAMVLLLPKGGNIFWEHTREKGESMISFLKESHRNLTEKEVLELIMKNSKTHFPRMLTKDYRFGFDPTGKLDDDSDETTWTNMLESSLPKVRRNSTFHVYCLYGVGADTELKYYYTPAKPDDKVEDALSYSEYQPPFVIDSDYSSEEKHIINGVRNGNGDGTVPLMSLGFMCVRGWKHKRFNPSGIKVITREYNHDSKPMKEADHLGIMGNKHVIRDVLQVVSGKRLENQIISNIVELSETIPLT